MELHPGAQRLDPRATQEAAGLCFFALCLDDSSNDSTLASEKSSRALSSGHWCEDSDNGDAPYKTFLWCEGLTRWPS